MDLSACRSGHDAYQHKDFKIFHMIGSNFYTFTLSWFLVFYEKLNSHQR